MITDALFADLLAELTPDRRAHSLAVGRAAASVAHVVPASARSDLVTAAVLHDVGYSPSWATLGFHPLDGAAGLAERGFSALVCDLVATHTAAAYEARERGLDLGLFDPYLDGRAGTDLLRRVVTWADLNTGPQGQRVTVFERLDEILGRYDEHHAVHRYVTASYDLLVALGSAEPGFAAGEGVLDPHALAGVHL